MGETEKGNPITTGTLRKSMEVAHPHSADDNRDGLEPTAEERKIFRAVPGKIPLTAYLRCVIEFAERASWYGVTQCFGNFINRPLPAGGNGAGATKAGTVCRDFALRPRV